MTPLSRRDDDVMVETVLRCEQTEIYPVEYTEALERVCSYLEPIPASRDTSAAAVPPKSTPCCSVTEHCPRTWTCANVSVTVSVVLLRGSALSDDLALSFVASPICCCCTTAWQNARAER